jgi:hypothetical protein
MHDVVKNYSFVPRDMEMWIKSHIKAEEGKLTPTEAIYNYVFYNCPYPPQPEGFSHSNVRSFVTQIMKVPVKNARVGNRQVKCYSGIVIAEPDAHREFVSNHLGLKRVV